MLSLVGLLKMKNISLFILFVVCFALVLPLSQKVQKYRQMSLKTRQYNQILKISVEDATTVLLKPNTQLSLDKIAEGYSSSIKTYEPNLGVALDKFYSTMYENFGLHTKMDQDSIKANVPLKMVVGYDGYWINSWIMTNTSGVSKVSENWTQKKSYSFYDTVNKLIINYTLDDITHVYNVATGLWKSGKQSELKLIYPTCQYLFDQYFDSKRKQVIFETISKDLEYYTTQNNIIAKRYGITYQFNLGAVDTKFLTSISDVSFIAFYQGIPTMPDSKYNTFAVAMARVSDKEKYYGIITGTNKIYHRKDCTLNTGVSKIFDNGIDAAKNGYSPCDICKP